MKETRVYVINVDKIEEDYMSLTNEEFMTEAENQGTVYSLKGFENAFNWSDINSFTQVIRII